MPERAGRSWGRAKETAQNGHSIYQSEVFSHVTNRFGGDGEEVKYDNPGALQDDGRSNVYGLARGFTTSRRNWVSLVLTILALLLPIRVMSF